MTKQDLVRAIERVVKDREIDPQIVLNAVKVSLTAAYKKQLGPTYRPVVQITHGKINLYLTKEVTDKVEFPETEISEEDAKKIDPAAVMGDALNVPIEVPEDFKRRAINQAKQSLRENLNEAEKEKYLTLYKDKIGQILTGVVRKVSERHVLIELDGREEGILPYKEMLPSDNFRQRDKVKVYALDVGVERNRNPHLILSRTNNNFILKLFANEVQEIRDGIVEVVSIARDPGSVTKIAVKSNDQRIDPVGACVGMKGMRVQSIMRELKSEKIEIIRYNDNIKLFITSALSPAKVISVQIIDEKAHISQIVVPNDQLSLAIGRAGQNAKLAAKLTGWKIDIKSETERNDELEKLDVLSSLFNGDMSSEIYKIKGIGERTAEKLIEVGITTAADIVAFTPEELTDIAGLNLAVAKKIYINANKFIAGEDK